MLIFYSKMIEFLTFFLLGASLAFRSHFGAMMHNRSLHTIHTITAQNTNGGRQRKHTHNEHKGTCLRGRNDGRRRRAGRDTQFVLVTPPPPSSHLCHSILEYARLCCVCQVYSALLGFSFSSLFGSMSNFASACPEITYTGGSHLYARLHSSMHSVNSESHK